jgi:hypothetical protein
MAYKELDVLLLKAQASIGTAQTSLANTDFLTVGTGFGLDLVQEIVPVEMTAGIFGQTSPVPGLYRYDAKISVPVIPTGTSTEPIIANLLKSSGMTVSTSTNKHTYSPSSTYTSWKDVTLWSYTGDKQSGDCLLSKAHSVMFDWTLTAEVGQPAMMEFTGMGPAYALPAAGTYVTGTLTPLATLIPATMKATTVTIAGQTYKILKLSVSIGNEVRMLKDPTATGGYFRADIAKRTSKWTATVYQENLSDLDPHVELNTPTLTSFSVTWGTAGSRITVAADTSKAQITSVKNVDEEGIKTFDLEGAFVDNGFTLVINDD